MSLKSKRKLYITIAIMIFAGTGITVFMIMTGSCKLQQDIYFTEYNLNVDTTIYKYDSIENKVSGIGSVEGKFYGCVLNQDRTHITGILYDCNEKKKELIRYDLTTGTIERQGLAKIIKETTGADEWKKILVYDGGNKFLASYSDKEEIERWLFYDLVTKQYDIAEGEKHGTSQFVEISDDTLWYRTYEGGMLYQYDLRTQAKIKIIDSVESVAVAADDGLVAYTKERGGDKIYLYNMKTNKTRMMAVELRVPFYGDLFETESRWSDDGSLFFYVKCYPGFAATSDIKLRACSPKTGKVTDIYEVKDTGHAFRFIADN